MALRRWVGNAIAVAQVDTVTIANTWATSDTATLTINGKTLTLTAGSAVTVTDIALAIVAMVNGAAVVGDETRSETGDNVAEFREITATSNAGVVTLTGNTAGKPFTLTAGETTAGDGTATRAASVACTGPNWFSDADNWSGATVPVDDDTIVFDTGSVDLLYDLATGIETHYKQTMAYTGKIGLPIINADDTSWKYAEYRGRYLQFTETSGGKNYEFGAGAGSGAGRTNIDLNDMTDCEITISNTGTSAETGVPALNIIGGGTGNIMNLLKGDVGLSFYTGEASNIDYLNVSYVSSVASDVSLTVGATASMADCTYVQTGGVVTLEAATGSGDINILGGTLTISRATAHAQIRVTDARLNYDSTGTITSITVYSGGVVDFSGDIGAKIISAAGIYKGGTFLDPNKSVTLTTGLDLNGCGLNDVTLDLGEHFTISRTAI